MAASARGPRVDAPRTPRRLRQIDLEHGGDDARSSGLWPSWARHGVPHEDRVASFARSRTLSAHHPRTHVRRVRECGMAFGQQAGPPATHRQVQELLELLQQAGHDGVPRRPRPDGVHPAPGRRQVQARRGRWDHRPAAGGRPRPPSPAPHRRRVTRRTDAAPDRRRADAAARCQPTSSPPNCSAAAGPCMEP